MTQIPDAGAGGPEEVESISGTVTGAKPGEKLVLYTHSGVWYVQPMADQPFTEIQPDSTWRNTTHLGTEYAALLVNSSYKPAPRISSLPPVANDVLAITSVHGNPGKLVPAKSLHFSGYDWTVRAASSDRGGEPLSYDPSNAWIDERGFLHLHMGPHDGRWTCAEVKLNRSLGFGTYLFVVENIGQLPPSAAVGLFTFDDVRSSGLRNELDIELSRWGNPESWNAQYVVQPFYVPENVSRFLVPAGVITYSFRWEPGTASFRTMKGSGFNPEASPLSEHTFTSGIPKPAGETVHINLYDFHHFLKPTTTPVDVVIEKFEYLP